MFRDAKILLDIIGKSQEETLRLMQNIRTLYLVKLCQNI